MSYRSTSSCIFSCVLFISHTLLSPSSQVESGVKERHECRHVCTLVSSSFTLNLKLNKSALHPLEQSNPLFWKEFQFYSEGIIHFFRTIPPMILGNNKNDSQKRTRTTQDHQGIKNHRQNWMKKGWSRKSTALASLKNIDRLLYPERKMTTLRRL